VRIAILGGGPAGCAAALALQQRGHGSIQVFEAGSHARPRIGESLSPDAAPLLQRLGLFEDFLRQGHAPCPGSAACWESPRLGHLDYLASPHGPGWHLDRQGFERWLANEVRVRGIVLRLEHRLGSVRRIKAGFELKLHGPSGAVVETCDQVIDAGGLAAPLARRLGVRRALNDELVCLHARLPAAALPAQSLVEACAYGWWYAARLPACASSSAHPGSERGEEALLMLATDLPVLHALRLNQPARWLQALRATREIGPRLALSEDRTDIALQPSLAASARLVELAGNGWWALGDAAFSTDPISAYGLTRALQQALLLADAFSGPQPQTAYVRAMEASFREHSDLQSALYARQSRWPRSAFWQARRQRPGDAIATRSTAGPGSVSGARALTG
jgi:flavin-dependent dehydrogenase